ncbi:uncharacterized protein LOC127277908 [Leptopilina boulardi]|uniref:uncharacterized protein LOC127277908 n=1 Tax=Leptopilina boulardi TaxID=63433 RepID=UPI0021F52BD2|nr:uncharacterized protein LOC127277908 [Leptopilina boulardi]
MDNSKRPTKSKSRKLPRPSDLKPSLNDFLPGLKNISLNSNFPVLIPIPPKDAKALGLKIPEASSSLKKNFSNSSSKSNTSKESCCSSSKEDPKTLIGKNNLKELENFKDSKNAKDLAKKTHKTIAKNPKSLEDTGKRSLKNLSSKNTHSIHLSTNKNITTGIVRNNGGNIAIGKLKHAMPQGVNESDTSDRHSKEPNSNSMRQLYSISDSWSSDSVTSQSDSCICCQASNLCPIHGSL